MKGIILARCSGTRLYPLTKAVSKHLLPIYDKPMIYYPLSILMMAGIRDILVISTSVDSPRMEQLLGDGSKFGIKLSYKVQPSMRGELEITTLNNMYLEDKNLHITTLRREYSWLDTCTHESLIEASNYIRSLEDHQVLKVYFPEEIALKMVGFQKKPFWSMVI